MFYTDVPDEKYSSAIPQLVSSSTVVSLSRLGSTLTNRIGMLNKKLLESEHGRQGKADACMPTRRDWLLLLIDREIDPIRIQKAMFKFAREAHLSKSESYNFVPYNWGPCSFAIYGDLARLADDNHVQRSISSGNSFATYIPTTSGQKRQNVLRTRVDEKQLETLENIREWVLERPFGKLLNDVYAQYPEMATKSLFR